MLSGLKGDLEGVLLSGTAAIPVLGAGAGAAKVARAQRLADCVDVAKGAKSAAKAGRRGVDAFLDATGKVHGKLPHVKDLKGYDAGDLGRLRDQLKTSVQTRTKATVKKGSNFGHSERIAQEQKLIKSIEKHLKDR